MDESMGANLLSCDIGLKRIGVAIHTQGITLPLPPILRKNRVQASLELSNLLKDREIDTLIVGIPQSEIEEEIHEMERRIRHFISLVSFEGETVYVDESYSSAEALQRLKTLNKKERSEKVKNGELDSLSAMVILERYLANL